MAKRRNPPQRKRGRPRVDEITDAQRRSLSAIQQFVDECGFPPTTQELADRIGVTTSSAYDQVNQLIRKGYLKRQSRRARGLTIVRRAEEQTIADLVPVPLVGQVAAGVPTLSDENVLGDVLVPANVARAGTCFALEVTGDSMSGAGIEEGDTVVVRQQQLARNGEIVVALVDGEATVKRLYWTEETIELRPENKKYRAIPIGPGTDFRIVGRVVAHSRGNGGTP